MSRRSVTSEGGVSQTKVGLDEGFYTIVENNGRMRIRNVRNDRLRLLSDDLRFKLQTAYLEVFGHEPRRRQPFIVTAEGIVAKP